MSNVFSEWTPWIRAEAEPPRNGGSEFAEKVEGRKDGKAFSVDFSLAGIPVESLAAHTFPPREAVGEENPQVSPDVGQPETEQAVPYTWNDLVDEERERRIYRARTVTMLRRYLRYSIETGRLPSLVGREFFRSNVTKYQVSTFEDRVIFVFDMEKALDRLDEFSRQIIARHILQEHDQAATGRLLQCAERTIRTYVPVVLDMLSEVLIEMGLMDRLGSNAKKSCQGGLEDENSLSDSEHGKNNF